MISIADGAIELGQDILFRFDFFGDRFHDFQQLFRIHTLPLHSLFRFKELFPVYFFQASVSALAS